jgi:hypothetical protein
VTKLKKEMVAAVVTEASAKMSDPNYSAVMVGGFVQRQVPACQFISAHERELGGADAIVSVIFHCALVELCFTRGAGRQPRPMSYEDLDAVAGGDSLVKLTAVQPAVAEFIESNLEHPGARQLVALMGLAIDGIA